MTENRATTLLLHTLHDAGVASRADLVRRTGLSASAVSLTTRQLLERGLLEETGTASASGMGRPRTLLRIRPQHALLLGANVDRERLDAVLTDLAGTVLASRRQSLPDTRPDTVVRSYREAGRALARDGGVALERVTDVGLALSGLVDPDRGTCVDSTVLGWRDVPIGATLADAMRRPVSVENDANAVAIGERLYGEAQGRDDFAVLSIGEGVGAGLFVDGRLHGGRYGASGELGHCTVEPGGRPCRCGKRGCLEAVASVPALLAHAWERGLEAPDLDALEALAERDASARELLEGGGRALGQALGYLVNLLSPDLVIVTGSGVRLGPRLAAALRESFASHVMSMLPDPPELRLRHEDEAVWARGAAGLAARAYLARGGEPAPELGAADPSQRHAPTP